MRLSGSGIWLRATYARMVDVDTPRNVATSSVVHQSRGSSFACDTRVRLQRRLVGGAWGRAAEVVQEVPNSRIVLAVGLLDLRGQFLADHEQGRQ
jgi:hypothetical protein